MSLLRGAVPGGVVIMSDPERGATITPSPDSTVCEATGCDEKELLALVEPDGHGDARALCPQHRVEYLREVYSQ